MTAFAQRLLATSAELVPEGLAPTVAAFAARHDAVCAAYLCLVERTVEGEEPTQELSLSFELVDPPGADGDPCARNVSLAFHDECPELARAYGSGTLGAAGIAAWRSHAQLVYERR